jgi:hypothetical protein
MLMKPIDLEWLFLPKLRIVDYSSKNRGSQRIAELQLLFTTYATYLFRLLNPQSQRCIASRELLGQYRTL